jgi:polyphosphate glucokinase
MAKAAQSGENSRMAVRRKPGRTRRRRPSSKLSNKKTPRHILVLDVGGMHVKFRVGVRTAIQKLVTGPEMTPARMVREVCSSVRNLTYDAVSIGYPGLVFRGRIAAEPHNLGKGWVRFDFARAFGKPVRVVNDAAMQAIGSYTGGRMLFLGLGTGLGATLIINGIVEPTEAGHLPFRHGLTFEDYVGERGRERLGNKRWRKAVAEVLRVLKTAFEPDYVVIGGGNAPRLRKLPRDVRLGDNRNAFIGGQRLWRRRGRGCLTFAAEAAHRAR